MLVDLYCANSVVSLLHLYQLDLLADSRQHILFQPVELIKAAPGTALHQTHEDAANAFEIKLTIAVEDQHLHHKLLSCSRLPYSRLQHTHRNSFGTPLLRWAVVNRIVHQFGVPCAT